MLIPKFNLYVDIIDHIIDTADGYLLSSSFILRTLCEVTNYDLDAVYLVLDVDMAPISIACLYDLGDDEEHFLFFEVELSKKELKYLEENEYL